MKRLKNYYNSKRFSSTTSTTTSSTTTISTTICGFERRKWIFPFAIISIFSLFFLFLTTLTTQYSTPSIFSFVRSTGSLTKSSSIFVESKLHPLPVSPPLPPPPRFAYLISGSSGDGERLKRTLLALYHPLNQYVVHLDLESSVEERVELETFVDGYEIFMEFKNVRMIKKANLVTYRGPTMVANTLHAAAVLLKDGGVWDWFINLSASDYPLVTQDDLLHTFSYLPRDLNFIDHTSNIGWKEATSYFDVGLKEPSRLL
ncbi:hypothetical protein RND81_10G074200 [Saponaria officinalis]|uniref:Uncharacterized protein n=1 Tax=Saponaria officinalis TaxID=3572 RepID=A0AAW1I1P2_SAPOF